jgi:hypothetical protein
MLNVIYAECRKQTIMLIVVRLSDVMLSVVAPCLWPFPIGLHS